MEMRIVALESLPEIVPGDDLARLIAEAAEREQRRFEDSCVVVVGQKIVSKAEGRIVDLAEVRPSPLAEAFARQHGRDARQIEVVLGQARRVVKMDRGVLLVETLQGQVCANAGVDASNVPAAAGGSERVTLLPCDADASAQALRERLRVVTGRDCAVIISDTFGRPWRDGLVDVAIGCAGLRPLADYRGRRDRQGRLLRGTVIAVADELAAAAGLVMGKTAGRPVVLIHGAPIELGEGSAQEMLRPPERDLFR
jgi:coenzyme F420-0:L-glutamate ligase/coenzyme F420-1:gamma-L-glutamate ligase